MGLRKSFTRQVDINEICAELRVTPERLHQFHNVPCPEIRASGDEVRLACHLNCGKTCPTGSHAISIRLTDQGFLWHCFARNSYCQKSGNDVAYNDLLRDANGDGKPRGDRFRQNLADYLQMQSGVTHQKCTALLESKPPVLQNRPVLPGPPLDMNQAKQSCCLPNLPEQISTAPATWSSAAADYFHHRAWFDPEWVKQEWQAGFLPVCSNGKNSPANLTGKILYTIRNQLGEIIAYVGRDPGYEITHSKWLALPEQKRQTTPEPAKYRFPKYFRRGLELFGQERIQQHVRQQLHDQGGLWVVEGFNDVIALSRAGIFSVAWMGCIATRWQVQKLVGICHEHTEGRVVLMNDLDVPGSTAMWENLKLLAPWLHVRIAWTKEDNDEVGSFAGMQPEQLSPSRLEKLKNRIKA